MLSALLIFLFLDVSFGENTTQVHIKCSKDEDCFKSEHCKVIQIKWTQCLKVNFIDNLSPLLLVY